MLELLPISFTFGSLAKILLIFLINTILSSVWYSPMGFQKQWLQGTQWKEGDEFNYTEAILMSNIGTLLSSFLLNILLIAFDIRKQQWLSAILASAILSGFYAFNNWNHIFFAKKTDNKRHRTLYFLDIGYVFVVYALISLVLVSF